MNILERWALSAKYETKFMNKTKVTNKKPIIDAMEITENPIDLGIATIKN